MMVISENEVKLTLSTLISLVHEIKIGIPQNIHYVVFKHNNHSQLKNKKNFIVYCLTRGRNFLH